jgi:hypothetical protein
MCKAAFRSSAIHAADPTCKRGPRIAAMIARVVVAQCGAGVSYVDVQYSSKSRGHEDIWWYVINTDQVMKLEKESKLRIIEVS